MNIVDHFRGDVDQGWREKWIDKKDGAGWFVKEVGGGWAISQGPYKYRFFALVIFWLT